MSTTLLQAVLRGPEASPLFLHFCLLLFLPPADFALRTQMTMPTLSRPSATLRFPEPGAWPALATAVQGSSNGWQCLRFWINHELCEVLRAGLVAERHAL